MEIRLTQFMLILKRRLIRYHVIYYWKNYRVIILVSGLHSSALSFPGAKSPQRELSLPWNFRSVEHSLPGSEKSKKYHSMELLHPWNFHSSGANVPRTFVHSSGATVQTTFVPFNFRSSGTFTPIVKKVGKAVKQSVHKRILANVRCCIIERKWCHAYIITRYRMIIKVIDTDISRNPMLLSRLACKRRKT